MSGKGTLYLPNKEIYEGEFKNGLKSGKGKYTYPNGDYYEGEWYNGKKHGRGIYVWLYNKETQNKKIYDGQFKYDLMHGRGQLRDDLKKIAIDVEFQDGILVSQDDIAQIAPKSRSIIK